MIRQNQNLDEVINSLKSSISVAFRLEDVKKQRELAAELFFWLGLAYSSAGKDFFALIEIKNMYEVQHSYAKEITRNIVDPKVISLIQQAEKEYLGLITEYSLEISTAPEGIDVKVNGKVVGSSPLKYRSASPKVLIELEKEGYFPIKDELFLTDLESKKSYNLESIGRDLRIRSFPSGAKVYLNNKDTGSVTDCTLPFVSFGLHKIKLVKNNHMDWEGEIYVDKGDEPLSMSASLIANKYELVKNLEEPKSKLFKSPVDLTFDGYNNLYVIDSSDVMLKKFSSDGNYLSGWRIGKKSKKELKSPAGIVVDAQGFIYITDTKKHCVLKLDEKGIFIRKWGKEGSRTEEFKNPKGIAADRGNNIYVVDSGNSRVKKYSSDGDLLTTWGKAGSSVGIFRSPTDIDLNQEGEIFVLDGAKVLKFSAEGEFLSSWGTPGSADGEFNGMGIAVDSRNFIYLADTENNRIQKFDDNGGFVCKWGSAGSAPEQMNFPSGIALDNRGYVFITDRDNNRVHIYKIPD